MKRILITTIAVLLAAAMLTGCGSAPVEMPQGSVKGNVYTCESAELTFTLPEGWKFEYGSIMGWSKGVPTDIYVRETEEEIYNGSRILIAYEDLAATGKTDCDEEAYYDLLKEGINPSGDIHYELSDYSDVKVGSNTFKTMCAYYADSYNLYYFIRRKDNCMICIQVCIPKDEDINSVIANFS